MSFVSSLFGANNGYTAQNGGGGAATAQQTTDLSNFNTLYGNQSDLAKQLLAQSQGAGPNIANLQLQQATDQNNKNAASTIASQRGMNPALAARLISNQAANNNQNAAGQSGVLRAQQQLASQGQLGNTYAQQAGETLGNYGDITRAQTAANSTNAGIAQANSNQNGGIAGGILGGIGSALGFADGGEIHKHLERLLIATGNKVHPLHLADGGDIFGGITDISSGGGDTSFAKGFAGSFKPQVKKDPMAAANAGLPAAQQQYSQILQPGQSISSMGTSAGEGTININDPTESITQGDNAYRAAKGGKVPVVLSPGELKIPAHLVDAVARGKAKASEVGQRVPGKAKVKGDSLKNDNFPTMANEGDVIVKRTKADNDKDAREFLLAIKKEKEPTSYNKVLMARRKNA